MQKIRLILLLVVLIVPSFSSNAEEKESLPFTVSIDQGDYITSQVNKTNMLTAQVDLIGDYSYKWTIEQKVVSVKNELTIIFEEEGVKEIYLTVINNQSKVSVRKKVEILAAKKTDYMVVGYEPGYGQGGISVKWDKITHLCYAFLVTKEDGTLDESRLSRLPNTIKEGHDKGVYVLISLGGGGTHNFSEAILDDKSRQRLVKNTADYVVANKLDGVDVDFEEWDGGTIGASTKDLEKRVVLEAFYKELREALPHDKLLSVAVSSSWENPIYGYYNCYTESMHQYWDFAGLMIYDQTGTWSASPYGQHSGMDHFELSIDHWLNKMNLPKEKLIAGVPFYGYRFKDENGGSAEAIAYKDIVDQYSEEDVINKDHVDHVFYNGKPTMENKCEYAKNKGIGGIMIWELTQDSEKEDDSLLEVINQSILINP